METNLNPNQATGPRDPWTVWSERPASADDVCRALANGSTLKQWTQSYNFGYAEVAHWLLDNPTRASQYERSLQIYAHYLRDEILELADDDSQDLLTDAKGKTTFNHAHFRRQGRQIEVRKALIRQITTGKRPAKDQKPYADVEAEINKILTQPGPYDPKGTLKGYKPSQPAYDPGPPPFSAATRQLGAAPSPLLRPPGGEGAQRAGEGVGPPLNTDPLKADYYSSAPAHSVGMASTPSPSAGSASASTASISEKTKLGTEPQGATSPLPLNTAPLITDYSSSTLRPLGGEGAQRAGEGVSVRPTTNHEQQTTNQSTPKPPNQAPKGMVGGSVPKLDWYKILGVRTLGAFLSLFLFFIATAAANLHASIHSLSIPTGSYRDPSSLHSPVTVSDTCCQTWPPPRSEINPPRTTNYELRTNPAQTSRHARDAPAFPLNTEH